MKEHFSNAYTTSGNSFTEEDMREAIEKFASLCQQQTLFITPSVASAMRKIEKTYEQERRGLFRPLSTMDFGIPVRIIKNTAPEWDLPRKPRSKKKRIQKKWRKRCMQIQKGPPHRHVSFCRPHSAFMLTTNFTA